jgi:hypothetical protein
MASRELSRTLRLALFFSTALALSSQQAVHADEVVTIETRPGVKQSFLVLDPRDGAAAKQVVVLFPADEGEVEFQRTGHGYEVINKGGGLTARRPMRETLRLRGFAVAVIAPPSDRMQLHPSFRKSAEHAQDIQQVIAWLRQRYPGGIYLHGHCLGSLSAASVASRLKDEGISGLIFSSARFGGPAGAVTDIERGSVRVPVLMVQHRDDACPYSLYDWVDRARSFFQHSAPKVDLITVTGGMSKVAMKQICKNGFHGFRGVEKETANAIATWLQNREFPALVSGRSQE